jgi:hypothetical protein
MPSSNHRKKVADAEGESAGLLVNGPATRLSSAMGAGEVVGPIELPHRLMGTLHSLAAASGVGDLAALSVCAGALVDRLSRTATPCRARIVRGIDSAIVPASGSPDLSVGFRTALSQAAQSGNAAAPDAADGRPVVVEILVSHDDRRLYVESLTNSSDVPSAWAWARAFLQLLTGIASEPDAPINRHPLVDADELIGLSQARNRPQQDVGDGHLDYQRY